MQSHRGRCGEDPLFHLCCLPMRNFFVWTVIIPIATWLLIPIQCWLMHVLTTRLADTVCKASGIAHPDTIKFMPLVGQQTSALQAICNSWAVLYMRRPGQVPSLLQPSGTCLMIANMDCRAPGMDGLVSWTDDAIIGPSTNSPLRPTDIFHHACVMRFWLFRPGPRMLRVCPEPRPPGMMRTAFLHALVSQYDLRWLTTCILQTCYDPLGQPLMSAATLQQGANTLHDMSSGFTVIHPTMWHGRNLTDDFGWYSDIQCCTCQYLSGTMADRTGRSPLRRHRPGGTRTRSPLPRQGRQPLQRLLPDGRTPLPRIRPTAPRSEVQAHDAAACDMSSSSCSPLPSQSPSLRHQCPTHASQSPSPRHVPPGRGPEGPTEGEDDSPSSTPTIFSVVLEDGYPAYPEGLPDGCVDYPATQVKLRDSKGRTPSEPDTNDEMEPADAEFQEMLRTRYLEHSTSDVRDASSVQHTNAPQQASIVEQELEERRQAGVAAMLRHRRTQREAAKQTKKPADTKKMKSAAAPTVKKKIIKKTKAPMKGSAAASSSTTMTISGKPLKGYTECRVDGMVDKVNELQEMRGNAKQRRLALIAKAKQAANRTSATTATAGEEGTMETAISGPMPEPASSADSYKSLHENGDDAPPTVPTMTEAPGMPSTEDTTVAVDAANSDLATTTVDAETAPGMPSSSGMQETDAELQTEGPPMDGTIQSIDSMQSKTEHTDASGESLGQLEKYMVHRSAIVVTCIYSSPANFYAYRDAHAGLIWQTPSPVWNGSLISCGDDYESRARLILHLQLRPMMMAYGHVDISCTCVHWHNGTSMNHGRALARPQPTEVAVYTVSCFKCLPSSIVVWNQQLALSSAMKVVKKRMQQTSQETISLTQSQIYLHPLQRRIMTRMVGRRWKHAQQPRLGSAHLRRMLRRMAYSRLRGMECQRSSAQQALLLHRDMELLSTCRAPVLYTKPRLQLRYREAGSNFGALHSVLAQSLCSKVFHAERGFSNCRRDMCTILRAPLDPIDTFSWLQSMFWLDLRFQWSALAQWTSRRMRQHLRPDDSMLLTGRDGVYTTTLPGPNRLTTFGVFELQWGKVCRTGPMGKISLQK